MRREYDELADQLTTRLNQKGSLIGFHVLSFSEYLSRRYPTPFTGFIPPPGLAVEWHIKIASKHLRGVQFVTTNIITDSALDIAEIILRDTVNVISHAIARPEEIEEAEIVIT